MIHMDDFNDLENSSKEQLMEKVEDLQNALNPLKDLTFIPFSSERKIYSENVWNELEKYLVVNNEESPIEIANKIKLCLNNKEKILNLYILESQLFGLFL